MSSIETRRKLAEANGLIRVYFPNGTAYLAFEERCWDCRHFIEGDEPRPPKLTAPHNICAWGILDKQWHQTATDYYGYGTSYHDPDDIEVCDLDPECRRFTRKDYGEDDRDPPPPDCPGQMMLGEMTVPVEVVPQQRVMA